MTRQQHFDKASSCDGKDGYDSFASARKALGRVSHKNKRRFASRDGLRGEVGIYRCFFCLRYHLGHGKRYAMLPKKDVNLDLVEDET